MPSVIINASSTRPLPAYLAENPYFVLQSKNPFETLPEQPGPILEFFTTEEGRIYLPDPDHLFYAVQTNRPVLFRTLLGLNRFDLYAKNAKGQSIFTIIQEKGTPGLSFLQALFDVGFDVTRVLPRRSWSQALTPEIAAEAARVHSRITAALKVSEDVCRRLERRDPTEGELSPEQREALLATIKEHRPFICLEEILDKAMWWDQLAFVSSLLAMKANPNRCKSLFLYAYRNGIKHTSALEPLAAAVQPGHLHEDFAYVLTKLHPPIFQFTAGFAEVTNRRIISALFALGALSAYSLTDFYKVSGSLHTYDTIYYFRYLPLDLQALLKQTTFITINDLLRKVLPQQIQLLQTNPELPCVILSEYAHHATAIVIYKGHLYKSNRIQTSKSPGIYRYVLPDLSLLTAQVVNKLLHANNADYFEKGMDADLHLAGETLVLEGKPQKVGNCTWSSAFEGAILGIWLGMGKDTAQAKKDLKEVRFHARKTAIESYLVPIPSRGPFLHCPSLLGAVLAKCLLKGQKDPEYHALAQKIMSSGFSIDLFAVLAHFEKVSDRSLNEDEELFKSLADACNTTLPELFRLKDPFYRKEETHYRRLLAIHSQLRSPPTELYFPDLQHWLCSDLIPAEYRSALLIGSLHDPVQILFCLLFPAAPLPDDVRRMFATAAAKKFSDPVFVQLQNKDIAEKLQSFFPPLPRLKITNILGKNAFIEAILEKYLQFLVAKQDLSSLEHQAFLGLLKSSLTKIDVMTLCYLCWKIASKHPGGQAKEIYKQLIKSLFDVLGVTDDPSTNEIPLATKDTPSVYIFHVLRHVPVSPTTKISWIEMLWNSQSNPKEFVERFLTFLNSDPTSAETHVILRVLLDVLAKDNPAFLTQFLQDALSPPRCDFCHTQIQYCLAEALLKIDPALSERLKSKRPEFSALWPQSIQTILCEELGFSHPIELTDLSIHAIVESLMESGSPKLVEVLTFFRDLGILPNNQDLQRKAADTESNEVMAFFRNKRAKQEMTGVIAQGST